MTVNTVESAHSLSRVKNWFRDSEQRYVLFRGINLSSRTKLPPYLPILPLNVQDLNDETIIAFHEESKTRELQFDNLKELGFNVVRLLVMWKAIEPVPNPHPEVLLPEAVKYLNCMTEIIDILYERGIFVIIDFHQDVANDVFDGDGFPNWVSNSIKLPQFILSSKLYRILQLFGFKRYHNKLWGLQYLFNELVRSTLYDFWKNSGKDEPRTHLEKTIGATARFFQSMCGNQGHPAILGYDLFNEPHPTKIDVREFEKKILPQYYRNAISQIRQSYFNNLGDEKSFIFIEPRIDATIRSISANWTKKLPNIWLKKLATVFTPPNSESDLHSICDDRLVFSFHYYDPLLFVSISQDMESRIKAWKIIFNDLCRKAGDNTIPFLSEFGADQDWTQRPSILSPDFSDLTSEVMEKQYE